MSPWLFVAFAAASALYFSFQAAKERIYFAVGEPLASAAERADEALVSDFDGHVDEALAVAEPTPIFDQVHTDLDWIMWENDMKSKRWFA